MFVQPPRSPLSWGIQIELWINTGEREFHTVGIIREPDQDQFLGSRFGSQWKYRLLAAARDFHPPPLSIFLLVGDEQG